MTTPYPGTNSPEDELADLRQRVAKLEARDTARETEVAALKAEVAALAKVTIPPLAEVRETQDLDREFFTQRLEDIKARQAGAPDDGVSADIAALAQGIVKVFTWFDQLAARIEYLEQARLRELERRARLLGIPTS
ncbi:MAG TPA: hypothetical protein VGF59_30005 [Bryobacteraceae bacterium]|jgi:hypothetical protein